MDPSNNIVNRVKPYFAVVFLNAVFAGMDIISNAAIDGGININVYVVYSHALATIVTAPFALIFERNVRAKMTSSALLKIFLLSALKSSAEGYLYFTGMKYTSATFVAAMGNALPAISYLLAWIFRLEFVSIKEIRSLAKVSGTLASFAGATVMTLVKGPTIGFPWTVEESVAAHHEVGMVNHSATILGSFMTVATYVAMATFIILQSNVVKEYPADLYLSTWISLLSTIECTGIALLMEKRTLSTWSMKWDINLMAVLHNGILCTGAGYYAQGVALKLRGPVFVTAFCPLASIMVAIAGSFILHEETHMGRVLGAIIIVIGLCLVVWGESKHKEFPSSSSPSQKSEKEKQHLDSSTFNRENV